jgi:vanillate O-demethylase ferredoxin subunit
MSSDTTTLRLRVQAIEALTPRIRLLELVPAEGGELPAFTAGAHIDVDMPAVEGRSYSLLNDPREGHRYRIAVLREEMGRGGSAWMHDQVAVGDVLTASVPSNNFPLSREAELHLLIAGGIGITPILSMVEHLLAEGGTFHLHYCARSRDEAAFAYMLTERLGDQVTFHFDGGDPAKGLDIAALLARKPAGGHVYVCGPRGMIRAVREATTNWPKGTVHWELFGGDEADTAPRVTDVAFDVELAKSGVKLHVPADRKLLDVMREAGVKVKSLCTEGVCGTCRVKVLSGEVDHRDEVLTKAQQAKFMQVCVSRAKPGSTLVLDL